MKAGPFYKGSPLYARPAVPTFFTLSCYLGAVTLNIVVLVAVVVVVVVVVVVPGARCCCRYTLQQLAVRRMQMPGYPSSCRRRQPQTPRRKMLLVPAEKSTRSRPADIKETFYEMTFTRDDSLTFTNVSWILLPRF